MICYDCCRANHAVCIEREAKHDYNGCDCQHAPRSVPPSA